MILELAVDVNDCLCRLNFDKQSEHWTQLINQKIPLFCVAESNRWQKNKHHKSKRKKGENTRAYKTVQTVSMAQRRTQGD